MQTVRHLAERARGAGAEIREGVEVTGFELGDDGVAAVLTSAGAWRARRVVACAGAVGRAAVALLGLDPTSRWAASGARWSTLLEGAGGRVRARGRGPERVGGQRGAGGAPRPGRAAALRPRRARARGRGLGHLLPHGPHRHRHHRRRPAVLLADPGSIPTAPTTPSTPPSRRSRTSSSPASPPRCGASAGAPDDWRVTAAGGIVAHTPDNYPVCDWVPADVYAIVDSGHGFKTLAIGRLVADDMVGGRAAARAVPARPLRRRSDRRPLRRARIRGPDIASSHGPGLTVATPQAARARAPRPRGARRGPPRAADHGHLRVRREARPAATARSGRCERCGRALGHEPDPRRAVRGDPPDAAALPRRCRSLFGLVVAAAAIFFTLTGNIFSRLRAAAAGDDDLVLLRAARPPAALSAGDRGPAALGAAPAVAPSATATRRGRAGGRPWTSASGRHRSGVSSRSGMPVLVLHDVAVDVEQQRRGSTSRPMRVLSQP